MGQIQWTTSLIFIGLFTIAIIGFAVNFASDNNSAVDVGDDTQFSQFYTNTTGNVDAFGQDAQDTYTSIINSSIAPEGFTFESSGPLTISNSNMISTVTNILQFSYIRIFGSGTGFGIFILTFLGLVVFITGLLIYKTFIGRNPE